MEGKRSGFYAGNPDNDYSNRGSINSTIFYLQKIKPFGYLVSADCPILFCKTILYVYDAAEYDGNPFGTKRVGYD